MTPEYLERVRRICEAAGKLRGSEREAYLDRACAGDPGLRAHVDRWRAADPTETVGPPSPGRPHQQNSVPVFQTGEKIADRYVITGFLGEGGMGQVYQARDVVLDRFVALKTIRPEIAADAETFARFKHEVKLAHEVADEHVCRVFDLDHRNQPPFLAMEYIHGETLSARLSRAKTDPVSRSEAQDLMVQIARGLDALHQRGIVHGDFKPGNIMLSREGSRLGAKIMDFGLARHQRVDNTVTVGRLMGTPPYMAPEQLSGDRPTVASDIYALGLVMFEIATGSRPEFDRMRQVAPSPRLTRPEIDAVLDTAILNCLARDPGARPKSAAAVAESISRHASVIHTRPVEFTRRRLFTAGAIAAGLLALAIAGRPYLVRRFNRIPGVKHIAVLPFSNIGGGAARQAFCDGIAETLAANLSRLERYQKSFWVVPTSDVRAAGRAETLHRALGVNLLLTGSVQQLGDNVRLIVNLVSADDQRQLDSRTIDAGSSQLSTLQDEVWASAAAMLDLQFTTDARKTLQADGTSVPAAYQLYLEGIGMLRSPGRDNLDHAIQLLQKAIQQDPHYAAALAGLGEAYSKKYALTKDVQWIPLARDNGTRAAELNPNSPAVHLTLGQIYANTGQTERAIRELRAALQIDPAASQPYFSLGLAYEHSGNVQEAEAAFKKLVALRPDFWMSYNGLGWFYYRRGRLQEAARQFEIVTELLPENPAGYENLGAILILLGRYPDAVATLQKAVALNGSQQAYTNLGTAYIRLHRYSEAVPVMERAVALSPSNDDCWRNLGDAYSLVPGSAAKAREAYQHAATLAEDELKVRPDDAETLSNAALYWAKLGNRQLARPEIARALARAPAANDILFASALVYELTADRRKALDAIRAAYRAGYPLEDIQNAPELKELRKDPEYSRWLEQTVR